MPSSLRLRFDAWLNRLSLRNTLATASGEDLAAGVIAFMVYRKLVARRLDSDYLMALSFAPVEQTELLLRMFKRSHGQLEALEAAFLPMLRSGARPGPRGYRIAAALAIQFITGHLVPSTRSAAVACIYEVFEGGRPHMVRARDLAQSTEAYPPELLEALAVSVTDLVDCADELTLDDLRKPLTPPPVWLREWTKLPT
jgi:hypothetical protein